MFTVDKAKRTEGALRAPGQQIGRYTRLPEPETALIWASVQKG